MLLSEHSACYNRALRILESSPERGWKGPSDYKGYSAKITLDEDLGLFHGEVMGIVDVVTFEGKTVDALSKAFHESVDDYLAFCKQRGEEPDKPYSGRFVVRVTPELHRKLSLAAKKAQVSMNEWVTSSLHSVVERESSK